MPVTSFQSLTMREIHKAILENDSAFKAARALKCDPVLFEKHLNRCIYITDENNEEYITFKLMKSWTINSAERKWPFDYEKPMKSKMVPLRQRTVRQIHTAIVNSKTLNQAATELGTSSRLLEIHLATCIYHDKEINEIVSLTYTEILSRWPTVEDGMAGWLEAYEKPMEVQLIPLAQRTMRTIHTIILNSPNKTKAAGKLQSNTGQLDKYLQQYNYLDNENKIQTITYDVMRYTWHTNEIAQGVWRDNYEKPMEQIIIPLKQRTIGYIHKIILQSTSIEQAATLFACDINTLQEHLASCPNPNKQKGEVITYDMMRSCWRTEIDGQSAWKEAYEKPIKPVVIPLNQRIMRAVHEIIRDTDTIDDAATMLGCSVDKLVKHLSRFTCFDQNREIKPITYSMMKNKWLTDTDAKNACGDAYEKLMNPVIIPLKKQTLRAIHRVIELSRSLRQASFMLGCKSESLEASLSIYTYPNMQNNLEPLTYDVIKKCWGSEEEMAEIWGEVYDKPINADNQKKEAANSKNKNTNSVLGKQNTRTDSAAHTLFCINKKQKLDSDSTANVQNDSTQLKR